jgi:hypothetical protein
VSYRASFADPTTVKPLFKLLLDPRKDVVAAVASSAILRIGKAAVPLLIPTLRTVTENERTLILVSLAQLAPGTWDECEPEPPMTLLVEAAGATTRYVSARWGGCDPLPEGTFILNLEAMDVLADLAHKT